MEINAEETVLFAKCLQAFASSERSDEAEKQKKLRGTDLKLLDRLFQPPKAELPSQLLCNCGLSPARG